MIHLTGSHAAFSRGAGLFAILLVIYLTYAVPSVQGQFPRVCAENATKPNGTCCPVPPGFVEPCGGRGRGVCLPFEPVHEYFWPPLPSHLKDDRLNWPLAFFKFGCACVFNFAGYMCQDCKWGYHGFNCTERRIQKRRNIFSLSRAEQQRFVELVDRSKYTVSEYVALKTETMDPIRNPEWVNITVHDFIIWVHFYSARNTYFNRTNPCEFTPFHLDFSHEGSAFPTFHRLLLLVWEREIQKLANDDTFTFPYWDWSDDGDNCTVCTNDLMGASTPEGHIDPNHRFSKWQTVCHLIHFQQCRFCDPSRKQGPIVRRPGKNPGVHLLPTEAEVDFTLTLPTYDVPPFDEHSGVAFRPCFEGSCPRMGMSMGMHGLVHAFLNGSMSDVATSTNDPIFILHHGFLDKIFELWIRKHRPHQTQFPPRGAPLGHNRDSIMVPFFPRHYHRWYITDSRGLGYTFDTFNYGKHGRNKLTTREEAEGDYFLAPGPGNFLHPEYKNQEGNRTLIVTVVGTPLILFAFLAALVLHDRLKMSDANYTAGVVIPGEKKPMYSVVSENDSSEEEIIAFEKKKNGIVLGVNYTPETKPLMKEYHDADYHDSEYHD